MSLVAFISFVFLNFTVLASSAILFFVFNNYSFSSRLKTVLSVFVLYVSQIILMEVLLGIFGALNYMTVSVLGYLIFLFLAVLYGKKVLKKLDFNLSGVKGWGLGLVIFLPIVFLLFVRMFDAFLQIPLEYDSVAYHLPFVVEWLKTGSLTHLYYSAFAGPISYYPSNFELIHLWVMQPFYNDFFVNLVNFPLFVLFGLAMYVLSRSFDISSGVSLLVSSSFFYMPIFLRQAGLPLVDLFFSLMFVLSIYYLREIWKSSDGESDLSDFVLFGLSLGLFVGTKYLGLVYGGVVGVMFLAVVSRRWKRFWKPMLVAMLCIALTGAFFYIRNWVDSGNPIFPVDVNIFGIKLFEGYPGVNDQVISTSILANVNNLESFLVVSQNYFYMTGWTGLMIFVFLGWAVVNFLFGRKKGAGFANGILLFVFALVYLVLYIEAPYTYRDLTPNVRYAMMFLILGVLNVGLLVSRYKLLRVLTYVVAPLAFLYAFVKLIIMTPGTILYNDKMVLDFQILGDYELYVLLTLVSVCCLCLVLCKRRWVSVSCLLVSLVAFWFVADFAYVERENLPKYFYESWHEEDIKLLNLMKASEWMNLNAPGSSIAYTGFNFHYHLYGRDLNNDVDYVNINECVECRYLDYKNSEQSIRRDPDFDDWYSNLKSLGKEYVVVEPEITPDVKNYEFDWMNENRDKFEQVFNSGNAYIFKLANI